MRKTVSIVSVLLLIPLAGCPKTPDATAAKEYDLKGKVVAVDAGKKSITLDHEDIPGLMAAMQMSFAVQDARLLEGLKPGDTIQGKLRVKSGDYVITALHKQ